MPYTTLITTISNNGKDVQVFIFGEKSFFFLFSFAFGLINGSMQPKFQ